MCTPSNALAKNGIVLRIILLKLIYILLIEDVDSFEQLVHLFKSYNDVHYERVNFQTYCMLRHCFFFFFFFCGCRKCEEPLHCKTPHILTAKNISTLDFMCTIRLNKSFINYYKLTMLWPGPVLYEITGLD